MTNLNNTNSELARNNKLKGLEIGAAILIAFMWLILLCLLLHKFGTIGIEARQTFLEKHVVDIGLTSILTLGGAGLLVHFILKERLVEGIKWSYLMLSSLAGYFASKSGTGGLLFAIIVVSGFAGKYLSIRARIIKKAEKLK